jgi:hypothetical protein
MRTRRLTYAQNGMLGKLKLSLLLREHFIQDNNSFTRNLAIIHKRFKILLSHLANPSILNKESPESLVSLPKILAGVIFNEKLCDSIPTTPTIATMMNIQRFPRFAWIGVKA